MTIAVITPPEGREEFLATPDRADSSGTDEVTPPLTGTVVLTESAVWRAVVDVTAAVVRVEIGNDDDSMISDEAEGMELGTGPERDPPGIGCVVIEVELVVEVGVPPMLDALVTTVVGTGVLKVGNV